MNKKSDFNPEYLKSIPSEFNVTYTWIWSTKITTESIDKKLDELTSAGIKCVYILPLAREFRPERMRTFLEPDYLSEDYFALVKYTANEAFKKGICMWIYDESGWPSGGANYHTVTECPECEVTLIESRKLSLQKEAVTEREIQARVDYGEHMGRLIRDNTFIKLRDFCREKNIALGGHLNLDNLPEGGMLCGHFSHIDCLRRFDVPGIDVIWEQIRYPYGGRKCLNDETENFGFFPRLATSAARQEGKTRALSESLAC